MRLLVSTDFALRVLMLLATSPPERPLNVEALSRALGDLSRNHLHKIVQELAALGVVRTVRGVGGGVLLAAAPRKIRIGSLIRQLEGDQPVVECFRADGGDCILTTGCRLRGMIADAREDFYRSLDGHTLADCLPRSRAVALTDKRARAARQ
ncbi:MAG: Rrf2 family transcriptional regulator [Alphaproteobacteria bacterium]|nr:Rrf2 family transcriptional regulator [Alphaproteobacteria bacterium]